MPDIPNNNMQIDIENLPEDLKASFVDNARGPSDTNVATPQNSGINFSYYIMNFLACVA